MTPFSAKHLLTLLLFVESLSYPWIWYYYGVKGYIATLLLVINGILLDLASSTCRLEQFCGHEEQWL